MRLDQRDVRRVQEIAFEQRRELGAVLGAEQDICLRERGGFLRERLHIAAGQDGHGIRRGGAEFPQNFQHPGVAGRGHGAGVDHEDIRLRGNLRQFIAVREQQRRDTVGFYRVDLASKCVQIDTHRVPPLLEMCSVCVRHVSNNAMI